jgi:hypothetical protein
MNIEQVLNRINDLLAYHKPELISNIESLGYRITDTSDKAIVIFLLKNITINPNLENMITEMISKYEKKSNAEGEKNTEKNFSKKFIYAGGIIAFLGLSAAIYYLFIKK